MNLDHINPNQRGSINSIQNTSNTSSISDTTSSIEANSVQKSKADQVITQTSKVIENNIVHATEAHEHAHSPLETAEHTLHELETVSEAVYEAAEMTVRISESAEEVAEAAAELAEAASETVESVSESAESISEISTEVTEHAAEITEASGETAAETAEHAAEHAAEIAEKAEIAVAVGASVTAGISIAKSGIQIAKDVKVGKQVKGDIESLKKERDDLRTEEKKLKNSTQEIGLGLEIESETAIQNRLNQIEKRINDIDTIINAFKQQSSERILKSTLGHMGTGADVAKAAVSTATAAGATISSSALPGIGLIQSAIFAPLNIAQLSKTATALHRVDNNNDSDLQILKNIENTKAEAAQNAAQVNPNQEEEDVNATNISQTNSNVETKKPNFFEKIRTSIKRVFKKEAADKTKAVVGTAIGIGVGVASLVALASPVGWALMGLSIAVGIGYAIFKAVRGARHKKKVDTSKKSLNTVVKLAKQTDKYKDLSINKMLKMSKTEIDNVFEAAKTESTSKTQDTASFTNRTVGGLFPKYETVSFKEDSITPQMLSNWLDDIKNRDESMIDFQIKDVYDDIKNDPYKTTETKDKELTALCNWVAKTTMNKGNEAEVKLWLEHGFDDFDHYKSPYENILNIKSSKS